MYNLVLYYPSNDKENEGTEMLYSPLALAYLATHTPAYYNISLCDEYVGEDMDPETIEADLVAVSVLTCGVTRAYKVADILRSRGIKCVIGGAHATALPEEALKHFDAVIQGEGEGPWKAFLADFENGLHKEIYSGKMNVPLEELGIPDRRFIHENYHYPSLLTSRGCPYSCSFCYLTVYEHRKYRTIPHDMILADMENCRSSFAIAITDENFIGYSSSDFEDRKDLLRKMIDRKFKFYWGCQATVTIAEQPELMELMYQAGCRVVFIGFEATDLEALKKINKKQNIGVDYKLLIDKIHKKKIAVIASTILGMDNQDAGYHKKLIKEIKNIKADFVRVFYMTAWPGTPLYKELEKEERVCTDWDKLRKDIPSVKFKNLTHEEAIVARAEIMRSFFKFSNILRVLARWIFIDRSLIGMFIKMSFRNGPSEKIRNSRARSSKQTKPKSLTANHSVVEDEKELVG